MQLELTPSEITSSWKGALTLRKEETDHNGLIITKGLRVPQLGAYYQVLSHWTLTKEHGIIVMPTGTGKTDTMITIMVGSQCDKLLVVVPSKSLRSQIGRRFEKLGLLSELGILSESAKAPKVGYLKHGLKTLDEVDEFFSRYNVIIATASIFRNFHDGLMARVALQCSHLILDEAHHSQAPATWSKIQIAFKSKPCLLFTATPFRNDEKPIYGKIIYNYPLAKAQEEGYFTEIEQHPISEYNQKLADEVIAKKAVELLEADLQNHPEHLLMARANNISRAEKIFEIYNKSHSQYKPILVHSNISEKRRKELQEKFESGESKIAVCVDMFGEGYDLPQIKIGAFHDMRRNITTALQLIGRYTRTKKNLGKAKFIYNSAGEEGEHSSKEIQRLLADDANWNLLIPNLTEGKNRKQEELSEFVGTFEFPNKIPLQNLRPSLSLVVYKAQQNYWEPANYKEYFKENNLVHLHDLSNRENTLVIVAGEKIPLEWIKSHHYFNIEHHLFIVHWMEDERLLLIHSSRNVIRSGH